MGQKRNSKRVGEKEMINKNPVRLILPAKKWYKKIIVKKLIAGGKKLILKLVTLFLDLPFYVPPALN